MKYYKVIDDASFLGVGTDLDMRMHQLKHNVIIACEPEQAQYIQIGEVLYRDSWMAPETYDNAENITVNVIEISEDEYKALYSAIESGKDVPAHEDLAPSEDIPDTDENTEITVDFMKSRKINEMNSVCLKTITDGFDIVLSDGEPHHFSLTTQDQLNLITLSTMVASGKTEIPYHADGELCKFYSLDDINAILNAATTYITYHESYFNALRGYIDSLDDIDEISKITYGIEIPTQYMSDVLMSLK